MRHLEGCIGDETEINGNLKMPVENTAHLRRMKLWRRVSFYR
jgi:hypothetical protein